jgi:hypothetical protein
MFVSFNGFNVIFQVASLTAAAEQQKDGLTKKISKIASYGIPV